MQISEFIFVFRARNQRREGGRAKGREDGATEKSEAQASERDREEGSGEGGGDGEILRVAKGRGTLESSASFVDGVVQRRQTTTTAETTAVTKPLARGFSTG